MHVNLGNNKEKLNEAHFPLSHPPSASNTIGYAHIAAESTGLLSPELVCTANICAISACNLQKLFLSHSSAEVFLTMLIFIDLSLDSLHIPVIRTPFFHHTCTRNIFPPKKKQKI